MIETGWRRQEKGKVSFFHSMKIINFTVLDYVRGNENVKWGTLIRAMQIICLLLMLAGLCFKAEFPLILAAMVMAACVVLSYFLNARHKQ